MYVIPFNYQQIRYIVEQLTRNSRGIYTKGKPYTAESADQF